MYRLRFPVLALTIIVVHLIALSASTADAAAPIVLTSDSTFDAFVCGVPVTVHDLRVTRVHVKEWLADPNAPDNVFFGSAQRDWSQTFTTASGKSMTWLATYMAKDIEIVDLGDGVWQFTYANIGQVRLIAADKVLVRDAGRVALRVTIFLGDLGDADDDELLDDQVLSISGPHPYFEGGRALFCETFESVTG